MYFEAPEDKPNLRTFTMRYYDIEKWVYDPSQKGEYCRRILFPNAPRTPLTFADIPSSNNTIFAIESQTPGTIESTDNVSESNFMALDDGLPAEDFCETELPWSPDASEKVSMDCSPISTISGVPAERSVWMDYPDFLVDLNEPSPPTTATKYARSESDRPSPAYSLIGFTSEAEDESSNTGRDVNRRESTILEHDGPSGSSMGCTLILEESPGFRPVVFNNEVSELPLTPRRRALVNKYPIVRPFRKSKSLEVCSKKSPNYIEAGLLFDEGIDEDKLYAMKPANASTDTTLAGNKRQKE
ncbi:hypothetical protein RUND412_011458, partial [Rhizina undulata]